MMRTAHRRQPVAATSGGNMGAKGGSSVTTHPSRSGMAGSFAMLFGLALFAAGCAPTVKIEAPDKPIIINVNVRIQIERDVDALLEKDE